VSGGIGQTAGGLGCGSERGAARNGVSVSKCLESVSERGRAESSPTERSRRRVSRASPPPRPALESSPGPPGATVGRDARSQWLTTSRGVRFSVPGGVRCRSASPALATCVARTRRATRVPTNAREGFPDRGA